MAPSMLHILSELSALAIDQDIKNIILANYLDIPSTAEMFGPNEANKDEETKTKEKGKELDPQTKPKDNTDQEPPKFGPHPDTSSADFDFKMELDCLPFTINISEAKLSREQQS